MLIFDGGSLPAKRDVHEMRRRQRMARRAEGERRLQLGDLQGARKCLAGSIEVTSAMINELADALEAAQIACMKAPFEATL